MSEGKNFIKKDYQAPNLTTKQEGHSAKPVLAVSLPDDDFEDDEDNFQCCDNCDLPDACADFGCAVKQGIKQIEW